jgi:uncharacterized membrane protein
MFYQSSKNGKVVYWVKIWRSMMSWRALLTVVAMLIAAVIATGGLQADTKDGAKGTVKAVLFVKPDCPDCGRILMPLLDELQLQHGDGLQILVVDNASSTGGRLYLEALVDGVLTPGQSLPIVVVGSMVLDGIETIGQAFSRVVDEALAQGGTTWPDIDGIASVLTAISDRTPVDGVFFFEVGSSGRGTLLWQQAQRNFRQDVIGNGVAVAVLVVMVLVWAWSAYRMGWGTPSGTAPGLWLTPVWMAVGLVASGYLLVTGLADTPAVCGPVGDCNAVQQSDYAYLFGIIPVALLGVLSYGWIICLWLYFRFSRSETTMRSLAMPAAWATAFIGVAFFIYLTFLEPFVIGATCAWCLTSAVALTLQLLVLNDPAKTTWNRLFGQG